MAGHHHGEQRPHLPVTREGMVFWMHYLRFRVGMYVRFDLDTTGTAINVEIGATE